MTMTASEIKITIDRELADLMPVLSEEALGNMEESILEHGCMDALTVWDQGVRLVLLDGHNRFRICQKHDLKYRIRKLEFDTKADAIRWAIRHQRGRRNLTAEQDRYLIGLEYMQASSSKGREGVSNGLTHPTAGEIAEAHGITRQSVHNAKDFAEAVDAIGEAAPDLKSEILAGEVKASAAELKALAESTPAKIKKVAASVKGGDKKAIKKATKKVTKPVEREPGDDTDAIEAEKQKAKNNGKSKVSPKQRVEAKRAFGVIIRFIDALGQGAKYRQQLADICAVVEGRA